MAEQLIGKVLGSYLIEQELAPGGMSRVYIAVRLTDELKVALKILPGQLALDPGFLERFKREAEGIQSLDHPNIVRMISAGEDEGLHYYAMEYVKGESLRELIIRRKRLPFIRALDIAIAVTDALRYAHSQGIIHRDVKPENIMLDEAGQVKLTDFGIAKFVGATQLTSTGDVIGTPEYMSPEQAAGRTDLDARSDIFSLGIVLYEMAAGRKPFQGSSMGAIFRDVQFRSHESAKELNRTIPASLNGVINKMLEKQPARRYSDTEKLLRRLEVIRSAIGKTAGIPAQPSALGHSEPIRKERKVAPSPEVIRADQTLDRIRAGLGRLRERALQAWRWIAVAGTVSLAVAVFFLWPTQTRKETRKLGREFRNILQMEKEGKLLQAYEAYRDLRGRSQHTKYGKKAEARITFLTTTRWSEVQRQRNERKKNAVVSAIKQTFTAISADRLFSSGPERAAPEFGKMVDGRQPPSERGPAPPWFELLSEEFAGNTSGTPSEAVTAGLGGLTVGTGQARDIAEESRMSVPKAQPLADRAETELLSPDDEPTSTGVSLIERLADSSGKGLKISSIEESVVGGQEVVVIEGHATEHLSQDRWEILATFQVLLEESFDSVEVLDLQNEPTDVWFSFAVESGAREAADVQQTRQIYE